MKSWEESPFRMFRGSYLSCHHNRNQTNTELGEELKGEQETPRANSFELEVFPWPDVLTVVTISLFSPLLYASCPLHPSRCPLHPSLCQLPTLTCFAFSTPLSLISPELKLISVIYLLRVRCLWHQIPVASLNRRLTAKLL